MDDADWRGLDDDALERLLVERWLYRGILLGVMLLASIITSYLGIRGIVGPAEQLTVGALLALALAAAVVAFTMRTQDLKIHRELRRRRLPGGGLRPPS